MHIMYNMAPLYVEFHMVCQTGIQPKACSIEVYVHFTTCLLEVSKELTSLDIAGEYAVVVHGVFIEGKRVEKIWPRSFFALPEMGLQG